MINITVFSKSYVEIDSTSFHISNEQDMIKFIGVLLDKIYYGGERICLESGTVQESNKGLSPSVIFHEIKRYP